MSVIPGLDILIEYGQAAGAIFTISTLGVAAHRYVIKPFILDKARDTYTRVVKISEQVANNHINMERALPILTRIQEEFLPNHGSSLRDAVDRMENTICNLQATDHLLLNLSEIAHFETDGDGNCLWANKAYCDLVGLDLADVRGAGWLSIVHPEDRTLVYSEWDNAIADRRQFNMVFRYMTPEGETKPVRVHAVLNFNPRGELIGTLGSVFPTS